MRTGSTTANQPSGLPAEIRVFSQTVVDPLPKGIPLVPHVRAFSRILVVVRHERVFPFLSFFVLFSFFLVGPHRATISHPPDPHQRFT